MEIIAHGAKYREPTKSPFGADDQIGMLNHLTAESRRGIWERADAGELFDLSVDFFVGMPAFTAAGDPPYHMCMSHTPPGTRNEGGGEVFGYSGDVVSFYTHTGTHVDALNHVGYGDRIFNGFDAATELGSRGWQRSGAENLPPIVARGVLLDVAGALELEALPESFAIGAAEIERALALARVEIRPGDIVAFRTGRMIYWPDQELMAPGYRFPGLSLEGARTLAEAGAIVVGTDCMSPEVGPSPLPDHPAPVHSYLLAEAGVVIAENLWLEDLAREQVYEFAFVAAPIRLRGATGAPFRPFAARID